MIPRETIEKAIDGGWWPEPIDKFHVDGGKTKKKKPQEVSYEFEFRDMWRTAALDPSFWHALGYGEAHAEAFVRAIFRNKVEKFWENTNDFL